MKRKLENAKKLAETYRPDKNSVDIDDTSELSWKIKPKKDCTNFELKFSKTFEEDDVEITVKVGGQVNYFTSPKGTKDIINKASFEATKRF